MRDRESGVTWIDASESWIHLDVVELWKYRELLYFLVWREVKLRYKQTVIGGAWAVLQPVLMMALFTLVFGWLARIPSDGVPYPVFYFSALLPWMYFATAVSSATNSIVAQQQIITKVYFPRVFLPMAAIIYPLLDFGVAFVVLIVVLLLYGLVPPVGAIMLPALLALTVATALGFGLWLSALNAVYRDIRYAVPFLLQLWMFASPVVYPSSMVPERWRGVYAVNPLAGIIDGFRWALTGQGESPGVPLLVSACVSAICLLGGTFYFRKHEARIADVV